VSPVSSHQAVDLHFNEPNRLRLSIEIGRTQCLAPQGCVSFVVA